ncbi:MAG: GNAT family N-acetyltransferase [Chloroflexi bacterium]|nr:GNAT family N-acetyltransferase [Chloroflexota bacterium]
MSLKIVLLQNKHLEDAAALVTTGYRALRERVPSLPSRYEDASSILPLLRDLAGQAPGVVAMRDGRLAGFLSGMVLPDFRGKRSVYSPEWANAVDREDGGETYREMYAHLSARWVADGCFTHVITLLAQDHDAIDAWYWLGFGLTTVDAIRDLTPVQGSTADVVIRRAGLEDIEQAMALSQALQRYLVAAPIFVIEEHAPLFPLNVEGDEGREQWLANSANALWLAYRDGEVVACMGLEPSSPEACYIIRDEKTISITSAFTRESQRSKGIATALLNHSLNWARSAGYDRCAVDFESQNISATRFWLKHFQPVCFSLIRHVDERTAWVHEEQTRRFVDS